MEANNPRRTELLTQAEAAFRNGRLSDVRRLCSSLLRANSNDADGLHLLGALQLKENLHAEAEKYVSRLRRAGREDLVDDAVAVGGLGAQLLDLVRTARAEGIDAEAALRETLRALEAASAAGTQADPDLVPGPDLDADA